MAVARAGGVGILDLGRDVHAADVALADICEWWQGPFGVRVPAGCKSDPFDVPDRVDTVVLASLDGTAEWLRADRRWRVLVEVCSLAQARDAVRVGSHGLIARGCEGGGRVGQATTFVLLQQLLADPAVAVPIWAAGGIGLHTAAAAVAGGAAGVVLDTQLALVSEMELPRTVTAALRAMDGSETAVVGGHRVYVRPDLSVPEPDWTPEQVAERLGAQDLRTQLLPVGQDGALAAMLADRFGTAGGVVQAIRSAIQTNIAASVEHAPLGAGGRFAARHGLRVSAAQGPMTHVSDKAAFAAAIAREGGLPFLALSLMSGDKTRALLEETATALGAAPWGAGILGFVPAELREAQLQAVLAVRPPYALIAGGRPAQAAELEKAGIATFLHVPSPGLLDQFLAQGARRFVFEGRECGGHVGPRTSFALWEAQIERLLAFGREHPDPEQYFDGVQVLFAGGIHDERSAAMVSTLAAPLVARGAGIGVLMGTAYLFAEEAVASGAIVPTFQEAALGCTDTVLLDTSPGHSTRCVDSPYVRAFLDTKQRMIADGVGRQQMWAELEQLNLGRLRIASKGLRRRGDDIVAVAAGVQRSDGMVMIGDVAALRSTTTTIAEIHDRVSAGATDFLATRAAELGIGSVPTEVKGSAPLDIAIVGMAGVFPQAEDAARYWSNVLDGVDAITEVSADRWDPALYYDSDAGGRPDGHKTPSKWGGFVPYIAFDALAYGIPPASLAAIEPVQLLALEVAARALRDAGYRTVGGAGRSFDRDRTSVIFGTEPGSDLSNAYGFRTLFPSYFGELPTGLDAHLPKLSEDSFPGVLGNVIAGRIANRLDLGGANYTVDAACASSLAALDTACKELSAGTSDMVLCGGADTHNSVSDYLLFSSVGALSASGRCRTFDSAADGIAIGEGVGCLVLKRLVDAESDGDRVYAVVKAIAGSSDGRSLGLTAPRADGQRRAMERAYLMAGVSPAQVGLVEAHGTGTVVGDRTELAALTEVFADAGATPGACALGSVKSQIGHTKCAAGLASLIKTARALYVGARPPTGNVSTPNGFWDTASSPFYFDSVARPWLAPAGERFAGVSSFGFGGTNFHAVLAGYGGAPEPAHGRDEWPAELFCFRGADRQAAQRSMERLADLLTANDAAGRPWRLRDLARTVAEEFGDSGRPVQVAFVASDLDDLMSRLALARDSVTRPGDGIFAAVGPTAAKTGRVAFLYPGQGSQRVGMLADLFVAFPRLRRFLRLGKDWYPQMYPPATFSPDDAAAQRADLTDTRVAQPALGVAELAMTELLATLGIRPDAAAGHSYGELVALYSAGVLSDVELLDLSRARGAAIIAAARSAGQDAGAMAAVSGNAERVRAVLAAHTDCESVVLANRNAPEQTVISGPTAAIESAVVRLGSQGLRATKLPVACAFHSPVVAGAAGSLGLAIDKTHLAAPSFPVWSNSTAAPYPRSVEAVRDLLVRQVAEPVRFVEQIESMYAAGVRIFVEAGPGRVLTQLVGKILGDREHTVVACDAPGESGLRRLLFALAELAAAGVAVDTTALFRGRDARAVSQADLPRRPGWLVNGQLICTADRQHVPGSLRPARELETQVLPLAAFGPAPTAARDDVVLEFLRSTRELMTAQRDVMMGYLGTTAAELPAALPVHSVAAIPAVEAPESAEIVTAAPAVQFTPERAFATLRAVVSERTGYPADMLDADLDLEGDLSIDSIKRIEIFGVLRERMAFLGGSAAVDESAVEELARLKTLQMIVDWLVSRSDSATAAVPADGNGAAGSDPAPVSAGCERYVVEVQPLPALAPSAATSLAGHNVVVVESGCDVDREVRILLERHGAKVCQLQADADWSKAIRSADVVVHLAGIAADTAPLLPDNFALLRESLLGGATRLLVATGLGGRFGRDSHSRGDGAVGLHGLVRTAALEFPEVAARAVDVDPKDEPERIAAALIAELCLTDRSAPVVVGYLDGERATPIVVATPLSAGALSGERQPDAAALGLGPSAVVLLTGGARGITAKVAMGLARVTGCHVELVGRTPLPEAPESPATAAATDRIALRRALIAQGMRIPADVDAMATRLLAEREIRSTLAVLDGSAASVRYHALDIRDAAAVRRVVDDIYSRHGRLDGVVHGAGILDDRLTKDKSPQSFRNVFDTKIEGARAIARAVREDLRFLVLFGSVSGVFGNRGQVDYAAANDALDTLAHTWGARIPGRVLAVDWGPWAATDGGMVTAELVQEYARRGIGVIEHDDGVACLLQELAYGGGDDVQVLYMAGSPEGFGAAMPGRARD
ncbi:type I polyketide synthase [Antrihabitans sp. YC2-6]|uniref:type I polyketide synthase n=1 Tax=Antrihabitans sp. YC2-6 TaxID=2799498 RepID=UPI0018F38CF0|nr:type I polyketide synthase [Antrihabitans sp. YC2-6]MBJ8348316.1 SDR family NAD(P)-dependent oxidoreductase [Antrihabitans sp. YC2-6]